MDPLYKDITAAFKAACAELEIGQLHHNSTFTLQGSIAALELMDPKMDSGMKTESMLAPIKTLDDAVNRGLALETLKPAELLGIMDDLVGALVSWLKGHSLVQTVFSCVYLHDVERIHDLSLKAFCVGLLKIVGIVQDTVSRTGAYEEEDYTGAKYGFTLAEGVALEDAVTLLEAAGAGQEAAASAADDNVHAAVALRLQFVVELIAVLQSTKSTANKENSQQLIATARAKCASMLKTLDLAAPKAVGEGFAKAFEPFINAHLVASTPPREIATVPRDVAYQFLDGELALVSEACNLFHTRTFVSIQHLFMMVNRGGPGLLARVQMFKLLRPNLQIVDRIDAKDLALDGVREYDVIGNVLEEALKAKDPEVTALVNFHYANLGEAFIDVLKIFCNNRARQRRKLSKVLEKLQGLAAQAVDIQVALDAVWQHRNVVATHPFGLHSFIIYHIGEVCIQYLKLGFELKLYARHEFHMIWFYLDTLLGWHNNNVEVARQRHVAAAVEDQAEREAAATESVAAVAANDGGSAGGGGGGGGGKKKKKKKKKAKTAKPSQAAPVDHDDMLMHCTGLRSLCKAMLMCCSGAQMEGKFEHPELQFNSMEILFAHRFKAFRQVDCLPQVAYQHFLQQTDVSRLPEKGIFADRLYLHAVKSFEDAMQCFQTLLTAPKKPPTERMKIELESLIRVAKTNMVSNRLAAMQSQQAQAAEKGTGEAIAAAATTGASEGATVTEQKVQIRFDFSIHCEFPVVKFR